MSRWIKDPKASVAIIGIGGLGHLAIKYGKAMGNRVTAITTASDKVELLKSMGADEVILCDETYSELLNHKHKFDFVLNMLYVKPELIELFLSTLCNCGTYMQIGLPNIKNKINFGFQDFVTRQLNFVGTCDGTIKETTNAVNYAHKHGIKVDCEFFDFEDFPQALEKLENNRPHFRCVVNVKDYNDCCFPLKEELKNPEESTSGKIMNMLNILSHQG